MSVDAPELSDLVCRVERLEKQNRWLKRAGIALVAAVGAVLLMGQAASVPEAIEAPSLNKGQGLGNSIS
jgi:hypothetical protein